MFGYGWEGHMVGLGWLVIIGFVFGLVYLVRIDQRLTELVRDQKLLIEKSMGSVNRDTTRRIESVEERSPDPRVNLTQSHFRSVG